MNKKTFCEKYKVGDRIAVERHRSETDLYPSHVCGTITYIGHTGIDVVPDRHSQSIPCFYNEFVKTTKLEPRLDTYSNKPIELQRKINAAFEHIRDHLESFVEERIINGRTSDEAAGDFIESFYHGADRPQ